jgi:pimeloyl-ACP methyl ester carboxylesterase
VARGLAGTFRVLEPFQRGSGGEPLTVARHVADLHEIVESRCAASPPALVGHSWGAMLALATAAAHPRRAGPIVLIGCGTFDRESRACLEATLAARVGDELRRRLEGLASEIADPDERLRKRAELLLPAYSCESVSTELEIDSCDARAHRETWEDMVRLQEDGTYPAAFAAIDSPVLMLHGDVDPHPGPRIRASLEPYLRRLETVELARCGHYPWLERGAREEFAGVLRSWLARKLAA